MQSPPEAVANNLGLPKRERKTTRRATGGLPTMSAENWKEGKDQDTAPVRRPFTPVRQPSFQLPTYQSWSAFDIFSLFLIKATLETIAMNSNGYAAQIKARHSSFRLLPRTIKIYLHLFQ